MKLIKLKRTNNAEDFADHLNRGGIGNDNVLVKIQDED